MDLFLHFKMNEWVWNKNILTAPVFFHLMQETGIHDIATSMVHAVY